MSDDNGNISAGAILAAEGPRGTSDDPRDNPKRIVKLIGLGALELDPKSQFYRNDVKEGDILFPGATFPVVNGLKGCTVLPVLYRRSWIQMKKRPAGGAHVGTWGQEPKGAEWVRGKGGGYLLPNGDPIIEQVEIHLLRDGEPYVLQFRGKDQCRIATAVNERAKTLYYVDERGPRMPAPFYGAFWRLTSVIRADEARCWCEFVLTPGAVYRESGGPDDTLVLRARDLCTVLEMKKYPDPPEVAASASVTALHSVKRGRALWGEEPPPHPGDDDIPF
jgi:hypothetical protein